MSKPFFQYKYVYYLTIGSLFLGFIVGQVLSLTIFTFHHDLDILCGHLSFVWTEIKLLKISQKTTINLSTSSFISSGREIKTGLFRPILK